MTEKEEEEKEELNVIRSPSFGEDKKISSIDDFYDQDESSFSFEAPSTIAGRPVSVRPPPLLRDLLARERFPMPCGSASSEEGEEETAKYDSPRSCQCVPDRFRKSFSVGSESGLGQSRWQTLRDLVIRRSHSDGREMRYAASNITANPNPKPSLDLKGKEKKRDMVTAYHRFYGKDKLEEGSRSVGGRQSYLPYRQELIGIGPSIRKAIDKLIM